MKERKKREIKGKEMIEREGRKVGGGRKEGLKKSLACLRLLCLSKKIQPKN